MTRLKAVYLTLGLLASFITGARCLAQEPAKTVNWTTRADLSDKMIPLEWSKRIDEIELEEILIDGKSIAIGEPFAGDFRNLRFRLKNISDKPIDFLQITLLLPEIKHSPPIPLLRIQVEKEGPVQPGQESEVGVIPGKHYDGVTHMVSRRGISPQS